MWKRFLSWLFGKKTTTPEVKPPVVSDVDLTPSLKILILPGHGENEGASTYVAGFNEAKWNRRIVGGIYDNYKGHHKLITDRSLWRKRTRYESYTEYCRRIAKYVRDNNVDLVIEQHINSADGKAYGTENMIASGHGRSFYFAKIFSKEFQSRFNIKPRYTYQGVKGILAVELGKRGSTFLHLTSDAGAASFLQEPFFANWKSRDSMQFLEDIDKGIIKMVDFYLYVIKSL